MLDFKNARNIYVISSSGYIFSYSLNRNISIKGDIEMENRYSHPASFYVRGTTNTLVFAITLRHGRKQSTNTDKLQTISVGKVLSISSDNILTAVIGMDVTTSYIENLLILLL